MTQNKAMCKDIDKNLKCKPISRISLAETFLAMPVGGWIEIHNKEAKACSIRTTVSRLHKKHPEIAYTVTEEGLVSSTLVKRIM